MGTIPCRVEQLRCLDNTWRLPRSLFFLSLALLRFYSWFYSRTFKYLLCYTCLLCFHSLQDPLLPSYVICLFVCYKEIEAKKYRDWGKMSTSKDQAALSTDTAKVFNNSPSYLFPDTATPWTAQTSLNDRAWEIWQSLTTRQAHRCVGWSWNSHLKHILYI